MGGAEGGREWNLCGWEIFHLSQSQDTIFNEKKCVSQCNDALILDLGQVI